MARPYKKPRRRRSVRAEQADYNALGRALARDGAQQVAKSHQEADKTCGRDWVCACGACQIVRAGIARDIRGRLDKM
jgi:hypothetical protein